MSYIIAFLLYIFKFHEVKTFVFQAVEKGEVLNPLITSIFLEVCLYVRLACLCLFFMLKMVMYITINLN